MISFPAFNGDCFPSGGVTEDCRISIDSMELQMMGIKP